jgi:predicted nucleotidyltransferase
MSIRDAAEAIAQVRSYFAQRDDFKLVLVYGSAARGVLTAASDVDVAVAGLLALDGAAFLAVQSELSALLGRPVDLIDLNRAEGLILREAVTRGLRVKTDARLFVKFQTKALSYREDFLPLQRAMRDARLARFIHGSGYSKS